MALSTLSVALAAFQVVRGDYSLTETTTGEPATDEQLCDCFEFDIMGAECGVERVGSNVCYTYRFKKVSTNHHCARSVDSVRLAMPARGSQLDICGLEESDLEGLVEETLPTKYGRRFDFDDVDKRFGLTFDFADEDSSRLFSACFNAYNDKVGSLQTGEIDISFDGGSRVARCTAPKRMPMFCAGTTAAPYDVDTTIAAELITEVEPITTVPAGPTTVAPSSAPTYVACDTDDAFNIAFVMDESGSVAEEEWDVIKAFVERIATFDVAGPSYVSLFEYASLVKFEQFQGWTNLAEGEADITNALRGNKYNVAGLTFTYDAVSRVLDEFYEYRATCDDGCDTRTDLLFLVTDGAPSDSVCPDMIQRANDSSVDIAIVAIGADADAWIDAVACLDIRDDGADIFMVESMENADDFNAIEGMIRAKTCSGENPAGVSDRGGDPWVYEDGNIGLGPVPTASGLNDAPADDS